MAARRSARRSWSRGALAHGRPETRRTAGHSATFMPACRRTRSKLVYARPGGRPHREIGAAMIARPCAWSQPFSSSRQPGHGCCPTARRADYPGPARFRPPHRGRRSSPRPAGRALPPRLHMGGLLRLPRLSPSSSPFSSPSSPVHRPVVHLPDELRRLRGLRDSWSSRRASVPWVARGLRHYHASRPSVREPCPSANASGCTAPIARTLIEGRTPSLSRRSTWELAAQAIRWTWTHRTEPSRSRRPARWSRRPRIRAPMRRTESRSPSLLRTGARDSLGPEEPVGQFCEAAGPARPAMGRGPTTGLASTRPAHPSRSTGGWELRAEFDDRVSLPRASALLFLRDIANQTVDAGPRPARSRCSTGRFAAAEELCEPWGDLCATLFSPDGCRGRRGDTAEAEGDLAPPATGRRRSPTTIGASRALRSTPVSIHLTGRGGCRPRPSKASSGEPSVLHEEASTNRRGRRAIISRSPSPRCAGCAVLDRPRPSPRSRSPCLRGRPSRP